MGFITDICDAINRIGHNIKTWMLISENLDSLQASNEECHTDISLMKGHLESLNNNYVTMNRFGTNGSRESLKNLHEKVDLLTTDVAVIKRVVLNGNTGKETKS